MNSGNIFFRKKDYNCENLNTRFHEKISDAFLKNPHYTPAKIDNEENMENARYQTNYEPKIKVSCVVV
jgi:hypothetical protein